MVRCLTQWNNVNHLTQRPDPAFLAGRIGRLRHRRQRRTNVGFELEPPMVRKKKVDAGLTWRLQKWGGYPADPRREWTRKQGKELKQRAALNDEGTAPSQWEVLFQF